MRRLVLAAGLAYGLWLTGFNKSLRRFQDETGVTLQRDNITLKTADGRRYVNSTRVTGVDVFDPVQFTRAVLDCYRQIEGVARYLRERVPRFERARIEAIAPVLGVRETRHIVGDYTLTGADSVNGTRFADSIAADASALDIHEPRGADVDFRGLPPYEIPYRCLLPQRVEQILVAGRCISADHAAHARSRNMPACMATGQAAGIAAAVAINERVTVRNVPVAKVQHHLRKLGMPLHGDEMPGSF